MKNNKNERKDNVNTIQYKVDKTLENFHMTEEMIKETDDEKMKSALEAKNDRRLETLNNIKKEVIEESLANQKEYK